MENNHFALLIILMIIILLTRVNCQNHKPRYRIAAVLPVLERNYEYNNSTCTSYDCGCSEKLRDDALLTVEALYYAFDFVKKNVSHEFDLDIEVIETCGNKLTSLNDFSNLYNETRLPDSKHGNRSTLKGVVYWNEYGPFSYDALFKSMNLIQCSISGPLNKSFELDQLLSLNAISATSGHYFILDVIFKILEYKNWKHVLSLDPFDFGDNKFDYEHLVKRASTLAERNEVCLNTLLNVTLEETSDRVIICFCNGDQIMQLKYELKRIQDRALEEKNITKKFVVIAGSTDESWNKGKETWEPEIGDLFYVTSEVRYLKKFHDYYASLSTRNSTEYHHLKEFRQRYIRFFSPMAGNSGTSDGTNIYEKTYKNSSRVLNVMKSIFLVAYNTPNDPENLTYSIEFFGEQLNYDKNLKLPIQEKFEVYKYQKPSNATSNNFIRIAEYSRENDGEYTYWEYETNLTLLYEDMVNFRNSTVDVKSHCSEPCLSGHKKNLENDKCCWTCTPCGVLEKTNPNQTSCIQCDDGQMPDISHKECISISSRIREPIEWYNRQNLICMCFSSLSIILTIIVSIIFIKQRNTPVVKSTTKELCYVMFAGIALTNITIFISVLNRKFKSPAVKVLPATGLTTIYAALLMKTIRIARILPKSENSFPSIHPKFVSITAQIATAVALIGLQSLICWYAVQTNDTDLSTETDPLNYVLKTYYLNGVFLMKIFALVGVLILFCMYFAVKTRNMPGNYNETKHVAFSLVTTIVIVMFLFLMYFISEYKILVVNLAIYILKL